MALKITTIGEVLVDPTQTSIDGLQQTDKASTTLAVVTISESGERNFSFILKSGADMLIDEKAALASIRGTGILSA